MASPPILPRHFKPDLTVQTGVRRVHRAHARASLVAPQPARPQAPLSRLMVSPRYDGAGGDHEKLPVSVFQNRSA
jgi:hypothetical protein